MHPTSLGSYPLPSSASRDSFLSETNPFPAGKHTHKCNNWIVSLYSKRTEQMPQGACTMFQQEQETGAQSTPDLVSTLGQQWLGQATIGCWGCSRRTAANLADDGLWGILANDIWRMDPQNKHSRGSFMLNAMKNFNASDDFSYAFDSLEGHNPSLSSGHVELLGGILSSDEERSPKKNMVKGQPVSVSPFF